MLIHSPLTAVSPCPHLLSIVVLAYTNLIMWRYTFSHGGLDGPNSVCLSLLPFCQIILNAIELSSLAILVMNTWCTAHKYFSHSVALSLHNVRLFLLLCGSLSVLHDLICFLLQESYPTFNKSEIEFCHSDKWRTHLCLQRFRPPPAFLVDRSEQRVGQKLGLPRISRDWV